MFKDKTVDLQNQTLKVAVFSHVPGVEKINVTGEKQLRSILAKTEINETVNFAGTEIEVRKLKNLK